MADRKFRERSKRSGPIATVLQQSEHFAQLVEGVEDCAVFLLDAEGHVSSWNSGARRIKGYAAEEILGKHFSVFYPPEAKARHRPEAVLRVAAREGRSSDEGWRVRKDGSRFWAEVTVTALRGQGGVLRGFLKMTRDRTERKQAEETLRRSEERFRLLVEEVRDYAIFLLDTHGRVASWNLGAERIKGYRAEEIIGHHFSRFYPPEAIAREEPTWELQTAIEYGRVETEGWRLRKDGGRFWANVVITALHDRDGAVIGFAKITRDMTEHRRVEALQEADRMKDEFLAVLAHELRNPLAPIRSALHVIGLPAAAPEDLAQARRLAERQVEQMARLLDDLLDVARISQGRLDLRREVVDAATIVDRAVEAVRPLVEQRRQELTVAIPSGTLFVEADPGRLEQLLANLLNNAAKYTGEGGQIRVAGASDASHVVLRVRDNGIGLDPLQIPRIFDLFVQAERRTDRSVGGVGVGLTLVKKLVELHGGTVDAFSPGPGKGSEFVVRLPRYETALETRSLRAEGEPRSPAREPLRILVVDDNEDAADALGLLLRVSGEQVRVAYDGPTAVTTARDFRPQVALLDIGMPGMDGHELARRLHAAPETENTILVALTGWGQQKDHQKSKEAGFHDHLVKPADPASLERLLADVRATRGH